MRNILKIIEIHRGLCWTAFFKRIGWSNKGMGQSRFRKWYRWTGRCILTEWEMGACWSCSQSAETACEWEPGPGCSILSNQDWIATGFVGLSWDSLHQFAPCLARSLLEADEGRTALQAQENELQMIYMEHEGHQRGSQPRKWDYKLSSPGTCWDMVTGWPSGIIRRGRHGLVVKAEGFCLLRLENPPLWGASENIFGFLPSLLQPLPDLCAVPDTSRGYRNILTGHGRILLSPWRGLEVCGVSAGVWWIEKVEGKKPFLQFARSCPQGGPTPAAELAALGLVVPSGYHPEGASCHLFWGKERREECGEGIQKP